MQYALVNGIKSDPKKGLAGICIGCGNPMIAKCGVFKIHHWAHRMTVKCDSWWETETEWHRDWKNKFAASTREISFYDEANQEYHRADIHTPCGLTIEFQNSPLSLDELQSRENFYQKLIWVVNGHKFKGFRIAKSIPNPTSPLLGAYELQGKEHLVLVRRSDIQGGSAKREVMNLHHPDLRHLIPSSQHYSFSMAICTSGLVSGRPANIYRFWRPFFILA